MARLDTFTNGIKDTKMAKKFSIVHSDTATHHIHVAHAGVSDGHLDKEIECFIAASENVEKVRPRWSPCKPVCKITLQKCVSFLPVLVAIGYLGYVVFAIYRQPEDAIAVSLLTPLVVYVCLNRFSRGKLSKCIGFVFKKLGKCVTLSRRVRLWMRRSVFSPYIQ